MTMPTQAQVDKAFANVDLVDKVDFYSMRDVCHYVESLIDEDLDYDLAKDPRSVEWYPLIPTHTLNRLTENHIRMKVFRLRNEWSLEQFLELFREEMANVM